MGDDSNEQKQYAADEFVRRMKAYKPEDSDAPNDLQSIFQHAHKFSQFITEDPERNQVEQDICSLFFDKANGDNSIAAEFLYTYTHMKGNNALTHQINWDFLFTDGKPDDTSYIQGSYLDNEANELDLSL